LLPLNLYARVRFYLLPFARETAGAARTRHSLLPLFFSRDNENVKLGQNRAARSRNRICFFPAMTTREKARHTHDPDQRIRLLVRQVSAMPTSPSPGVLRLMGEAHLALFNAARHAALTADAARCEALPPFRKIVQSLNPPSG
jgi:hypothetical protein